MIRLVLLASLVWLTGSIAAHAQEPGIKVTLLVVPVEDACGRDGYETPCPRKITVDRFRKLEEKAFDGHFAVQGEKPVSQRLLMDDSIRLEVLAEQKALEIKGRASRALLFRMRLGRGREIRISRKYINENGEVVADYCYPRDCNRFRKTDPTFFFHSPLFNFVREEKFFWVFEIRDRGATNSRTFTWNRHRPWRNEGGGS